MTPCYNSAAPGDVLTTFAAGLGKADPSQATGIIPPFRVSTVVKPGVTVGGRAAEVLDAVLANWYLGVYEVRFRVPRETPEGIRLVAVNLAGKTRNEIPLTVKKASLNYPAPESRAAPDSIGLSEC